MCYFALRGFIIFLEHDPVSLCILRTSVVKEPYSDDPHQPPAASREHKVGPPLTLPHRSRVSHRRQSHNRPEIPNEVSLVTVTQAQSQLRMTDRLDRKSTRLNSSHL